MVYSTTYLKHWDLCAVLCTYYTTPRNRYTPSVISILALSASSVVSEVRVFCACIGIPMTFAFSSSSVILLVCFPLHMIAFTAARNAKDAWSIITLRILNGGEPVDFACRKFPTVIKKPSQDSLNNHQHSENNHKPIEKNTPPTLPAVIQNKTQVESAPLLTSTPSSSAMGINDMLHRPHKE